jgi:hypothetical protein
LPANDAGGKSIRRALEDAAGIEHGALELFTASDDCAADYANCDAAGEVWNSQARGVAFSGDEHGVCAGFFTAWNVDDIWSDSGELTFPVNALGLFFNEVDVVYNAGWSTIPTPVQVACAQIVRNAQATPGLNVQSSQVNQMRLQYFGPTLMDEMVKSLLSPYVAIKGS